MGPSSSRNVANTYSPWATYLAMICSRSSSEHTSSKTNCKWSATSCSNAATLSTRTEIRGPTADLLFAEPDHGFDRIAAQPKLPSQGDHVMLLIQSAHFRKSLTAS